MTDEEAESDRILNKLKAGKIREALLQFLWLPVKFGDDTSIEIMMAALEDWSDDSFMRGRNTLLNKGT